MYRLQLILVAFLFSTLVFPQSDSELNVSSKSTKTDTSFIDDKSDYLNLFIFGKSKYNSFSIIKKETEQMIKYAPNSNFNIGFGFNYKWMGLGIAFNLPAINNDDEKYGKTQSFDAQMNIFAHKYSVDFYLNYYKGYYVQNPEVLGAPYSKKSPPPTIPSMETNTLGLSYFYVLNHKRFSYRASFIQNERQKKMAGSMIVGIISHFNRTLSDTSFIPDLFLEDVEAPEKYKIRGLASFDIGPMFGYGYNFIIKKRIMITLSTVPGLVYQRIITLTTINGVDTTESNNKIGFVISTKIALIYNGETYYYGINFSDFRSNHNYENVGLATNVGNFRFFFGRRFNVKKKK